MVKQQTREELTRRIKKLEKEAARRKKAEKALRSRELQYRKIFDSATDGLLIYDRDGHIVEANPQVCKMYGYTYEEFITLSREDICHPEYHFLFEQFKRETKERGEFTGESKDVKKGGSTFMVEVRGTEFQYRDKRHVLAMIRDITERKQAEEELRKAFSKIEQLKEQLEKENMCLREEIEVTHKHEEIIGRSDAIRNVLSKAEQVAQTGATVLVLGETGTGKELLARAIHHLSARQGRPMVKVNCAALPTTLIESELFGHEKGAFTGAVSRQIGRFELAHGSTIFLDEISEIPLELQAKLLRVLQEGQFERVGGTKIIDVDVRVIAASNRDLTEALQTGSFREDLYFRLNVFPIAMPPLRDRRDDIPLMIWAFVREFEKSMGKRIETISKRSMVEVHRYPWPGNVRELRNIVERAMIINKGPTLHLTLPELTASKKFQGLTLREMERRHILDVLERTGWRVSGKRGAAVLLGLNESTLRSRMQRLGIKRFNN